MPGSMTIPNPGKVLIDSMVAAWRFELDRTVTQGQPVST